jgi:hypothetical protein
VQQAFCALRSGGQLAQLAIALLIALDRYWCDPGPVTGRTPGTPVLLLCTQQSLPAYWCCSHFEQASCVVLLNFVNCVLGLLGREGHHVHLHTQMRSCLDSRD